MLNNKKFLILLLAVFFYINVHIPLNDANTQNIDKLLLYKTKYETIKKILEKKEEYEQLFSESKKNLEQNQVYLFDARDQNAMLYNQIQMNIKNITKKYGAELLNTSWGEPFMDEEYNYEVLPYTFIVKLHPNDISAILNDFFTQKKAIKIIKLHIGKNRNDIVVNVQVLFFKNSERGGENEK